MIDARISVGLPAHPKTKKLIRRLGEGGAWRLTPQGRRFMEIARFMSWLVDADPRFVGRK